MRYGERLSSTHLWDGVNLHHLLDYALDPGSSLGLVLAQQDEQHYLGLSLSLRAAWPSWLGGDPSSEPDRPGPGAP